MSDVVPIRGAAPSVLKTILVEYPEDCIQFRSPPIHGHEIVVLIPHERAVDDEHLRDVCLGFAKHLRAFADQLEASLAKQEQNGVVS